MAKNTLWNDHIKKFLPHDLVRETNETELEITLTNGNTITLFGADDPDRLRGANWEFAVLDEFQDFKPSSWEYVIEPNLLATKGRTLKMGTPKGMKNILHEQYALDDPEYQAWHFTSYDSPIIDQNKLEAIRQRLIRSNKEDVWKQEYLAEFTTIAGLIYTIWDRQVHVKEMEIKEGAFGLAIDRGIDNPSAVGFYNIYQTNGDDRIYMFDEIYQTGLSSSELINLIKLKMGNKPFMYQVCDPSAKDFMVTANEMGLPIQPASREGAGESWVLDGIAQCKDLLAKSPIDGQPKFTISPRCKNFIEEIEGYIWDEQPDKELNAKDRPRKLNDHCFAGETSILTKAGYKPIKNIKKGEFVWSPFGWNEVYRSKMTGRKKVRFYGYFRSTPDHKILTSNGLVEVDKLRYSDKILVWEEQRPYTLMEFLIGAIRVQKDDLMHFIFGALLTKAKMARRDFYIEMFGNTTRVKFLIAIWFIILIAILGIITLGILSLSLLVNTLKGIIGVIGAVWKNILKKYEIRLKSGINRKKDICGTQDRQKKHGKKESLLLKLVQYVENHIKPITLLSPNSVILTAKQQPFVEEEVYNLATKFGCYFANGILVSNSVDQWRYFAVSYTKPINDNFVPEKKNWQIA
jgi:hypothetical protein